MGSGKQLSRYPIGPQHPFIGKLRNRILEPHQTTAGKLLQAQPDSLAFIRAPVVSYFLQVQSFHRSQRDHDGFIQPVFGRKDFRFSFGQTFLHRFYINSVISHIPSSFHAIVRMRRRPKTQIFCTFPVR